MKSVSIILSLITPLLLPTPSYCQAEHTKLRPSSGYWERNVRNVPVHITRLSRNRRLATVGDSLYMLNARNHVIWSWSSGGAPFTDLPIIDSKGTIYVIGYDLLWAAVDSTDGKAKWCGTANGKAVYSQIKLYKDDMYLVVTDMGGYRGDAYLGEVIKDRLTLSRGNSILWDGEIPAGAKIQIRGSKVFAVVKRKNRIWRNRVAIPSRFGEPIGKVSALVDYE